MTPPAQSPKRRVLLVDDEESLVWSLSSRLGKCRPQYSVLTANDGETALVELTREPVELLVVDVRMPGMSGIDLVLAARAMAPELPVIVMTAFKTVDVSRIEGGTSTSFLQKPFEFEVFLELVDRALVRNRGFSGAVSVQSLPELVQLYVLSNTSGKLAVRHGGAVGLLWFDRGTIVHAAAVNLLGEDAFYEILSWPAGEFSMAAFESPPSRSIVADWQGLLLESCRRIDEGQRGERGERGWTESPPSWPSDPFSEFEARLEAPRAPSIPLTLDDYLVETHAMNIKDSLAKLSEIDGFVGAAVVDSESGMLLGHEGGGSIDLEVAAAGNTEVVRAKRKTMASLNIKDGIEDILITLGRQYHLIRPLRARNAVFFYIVLDRQRANLAMSRIALADVEKELTL